MSRRSYVAGGAIVQAMLVLGGCNAPDGGQAPVARATIEAAPPAAARAPMTGPKRVVLAFGDSLYAGYGLRKGESLPDAIEAGLRAAGIDATVVNAGVSGDTTAGGRRRLAYTLDRLERAPDLVVLGLGGNDVLRQLDPADTRANLTAMLAELRRRKLPVVLTGILAPPNLGPDYAGRFNAIFPALARENDAPLDPFILAGVIGNRALMLPDGVHPNAKGVARIAERLTPLVRDRLTALPPPR
ncbi:MAG: arylesterase [Pseudomonadota bacterium]